MPLITCFTTVTLLLTLFRGFIPIQRHRSIRLISSLVHHALQLSTPCRPFWHRERGGTRFVKLPEWSSCNRLKGPVHKKPRLMEEQTTNHLNSREASASVNHEELRLKIIQAAGGNSTFARKLRGIIWQKYCQAGQPFGASERGMMEWLAREAH